MVFDIMKNCYSSCFPEENMTYWTTLASFINYLFKTEGSLLLIFIIVISSFLIALFIVYRNFKFQMTQQENLLRGVIRHLNTQKAFVEEMSEIQTNVSIESYISPEISSYSYVSSITTRKSTVHNFVAPTNENMKSTSVSPDSSNIQQEIQSSSQRFSFLEDIYELKDDEEDFEDENKISDVEDKIKMLEYSEDENEKLKIKIDANDEQEKLMIAAPVFPIQTCIKNEMGELESQLQTTDLEIIKSVNTDLLAVPGDAKLGISFDKKTSSFDRKLQISENSLEVKNEKIVSNVRPQSHSPPQRSKWDFTNFISNATSFQVTKAKPKYEKKTVRPGTTWFKDVGRNSKRATNSQQRASFSRRILGKNNQSGRTYFSSSTERPFNALTMGSQTKSAINNNLETILQQSVVRSCEKPFSFVSKLKFTFSNKKPTIRSSFHSRKKGSKIPVIITQPLITSSCLTQSDKDATSKMAFSIPPLLTTSKEEWE